MVILIEMAYTIVYREVLMRRFSVEGSQIISLIQLYFLLFFQVNQLITIYIFDSWIVKIFHLIFHTEYIIFRLIEPNFWILILQIGLGFATLLYYNSEFLKKKNFWKQTIKYENSRGWQYLIDQFLPLQIFVVSYSKQIKRSCQDNQQPQKGNVLKQQNPSTIKQFNSTNLNSNKDTKIRNATQQFHELSDKCKSENYAKDSQQQDSSSFKLIRKEDLEVLFCNKNILQIFNLTQKNDLIDIAENMFFPSVVQHQTQPFNFQKLDSPESKQTDPQFMNTVTKIKCNDVSSSEMSCDESQSTSSQKFVPKNLLEKLQYDLYPLFLQEQFQNSNSNQEQGQVFDDEEQHDDNNQKYDFESFNQYNQSGNIQFNQIFQDFEFLKCSNSNNNNGDIYCNIKYCDKNKKNKTFDLKIIKCMWKKKSSFIVMMTDISKKEQMQRMREIDKFKDKVIDSITHNLKTPLNGILLSCQTLQMNLKQSENLEILEHIYQNSFILLNMINDILDYSRFLKDQLKLEMKEYSMSSILDEIYAIMKLQFDVKKLQFNIKDYTIDAKIKTDKNRLIQVLLQFLTNSIKFTQKGYVKLKVFKQKNAFKFTIEDTGQGMSKQQIERLGNLFMQPHKSYQHGVGLGFIMCKNLLDKMSSENNLTVVSEENKGTTVVFFIRSDHPQNKIQNRQITENNNNELQNQKQNLVTVDHSEEQNNPKMQKKNSFYIMACDHLKQALENEIQDNNKEKAMQPQLNKKYIPHLNTQNLPQKQLDDQYGSQEYSIGHNQQSFINFKQEKIFYTPESIHNAKLPPHFGSPSLFSLTGQRDSIVMDQSHYLYGNNQQQLYGKSSFHDNPRIPEIKQDIDTQSKQIHSQQDLQQSRRSSQNKRIVTIFQDKNRENLSHNNKLLTYPQDMASLQKYVKTLNHLTENNNQQHNLQQNKFNSRTNSLYQEEYLPQLNMEESIFVCPNQSSNNLNQKSFNCINFNSISNKNKIQSNNNNNNNLQQQAQFVNITKQNSKQLFNTNFQKPQQPSINLISQIYVSSHSDSSNDNNEDDKDLQLREKQMSENKQQIKVYCQEKKIKDYFSCFHFSNSITWSQSQNMQREDDQIQEDQEKLIFRHLNFQNLRSTPQKCQQNEQINQEHSVSNIQQYLTTPTLKYIEVSPLNDKCEQKDNLLNNHSDNQITQSPAANIPNVSQQANKAQYDRISASISCFNNQKEVMSKTNQIQKQKIVSQVNLEIPSDQAIQPQVNTTYQDIVVNIQNLIENKINKILIVDDNPFNILCLQTLLKKFNFLKTYEAHDGKEAVEKVQKEHFDLILMDVNMPVMDGLEATARIKEMLRNNIIEPTKIFIVTAFGDSLDKQKALKIGADAHICKPMTLATLYNELKHNF